MAKSKSVPFRVFYGGENYLLDREVQRGKSWSDRNVTLLLEALEPSFFGTDSVVILDNAQAIKLGDAFDQYVESKSTSDLSVVLVVVCRSEAFPLKWVRAGQKGTKVEHQTLKPWESAAIHRRLVREASSFGLGIHENASAFLSALYDQSLGSMVNDIQKLSFILEKGSTIGKEDLLKVCSRQMAIQPWDVSEAAAKKAVKRAMNLTSLLFRAHGDIVAIPIVASLLKKAERLLVAASYSSKGYSSKSVAQALGLHEYNYQKNVEPQVKLYSVDELITQMQKLCELESLVKGQAQSKRTLVELAVHSFAV